MHILLLEYGFRQEGMTFIRKLWDSSRCNHHFSYNDMWNVFNKEAPRDFIKNELGD